MFGDDTLARTHAPPENHRHLTRPVRLLNSSGKPVEKVLVVFLVSTADVLPDVFEKQRAVPRLGLAGEALPQVVAV